MDASDDQLLAMIVKMQDDLTTALEELSQLTVELKRFREKEQQERSLTATVFGSLDEERAQVMRSLFSLRGLGIVNMMNADEYLQKRFGFTQAKARQYLFDFIDNCQELEPLYSCSNNTVSKVPDVPKKTVLKSKKVLAPKPDAPEVTLDTPKPNALQVWNSFVNTIKLEIFHSTGVEPSYNEYLKKAQEMKEADPDSYKLFAENWSN
jgi:hypothetical protein